MSAASEARDAYRLGLMGPQNRAQYEDAVKLGIVKDDYAATRLHQRGNAALQPAASATTVQRAIPGLSEIGAGVAAGIDTMGDVVRGAPADFGAHWKHLRDIQSGQVDQFRQDHPTGSALSTGVGYAAQAVPALASGGGTVAPQAAAAPGLRGAAGRAAMATARNATAGATYAAVNGASLPGTLQERIDRAKAATPGGAVAGVVVPGAMAAASGVARRVVAPIARRGAAVASQAVDAATQALSGRTPADIAQVITPQMEATGQRAALDYLARLGATPESLRSAALAANGKPITTLEAIGAAGIGEGTGLVRRGGTSASVADAVLSARMADRGQRILADITDATGVEPSAAMGHIDALVAHGRKMAKPMFDKALSGDGPVWNAELAQWAQTPIGKKAIASASNEIRNIPGGDPTRMGLPIDPDTGAIGSATPGLNDLEPQPTAAAWDLIRKHVGDQVDRDAFGRPLPDSQSRGNWAVNQNKGFLTSALAGDGTAANPGLLPGYRQALDHSSDYLGIKSAFDNARGMLMGKTAKADPTQFAAWFPKLKPIEQEAVKASMANDILTGVQNGTLRPGSFALPHVQMKLQTAFGPDAAAEITGRMSQEQAMAAAEARMRPNLNSTTGNVMGGIVDHSDEAGDAALHALGHAFTGNAKGAVKSLSGGLSPYISAARNPMDVAARNALGDLGFADPADVAHMLEAHQALPAPVAIPMLPTGRVIGTGLAIRQGTDQP